MIKIHFNSIVILVLGLVLFSCNIPNKKLKFAIIQYSHETCTFCPGGDTKIEDWTEHYLFLVASTNH